MAYEIIAVMTTTGHQKLAESIASSSSFVVKYFSLGDQGHDPTDPTIALSPDPSVTVCNNGLGAVFGPKSIEGYLYSGAFCPTFICRIEKTEYVGDLSQLCLIAEVTADPVTPANVGTTFLFALANYPRWPKTDSDSREFQVSIQLK